MMSHVTFVTWIVTQMAALRPGFELNGGGGWTHVCIIIQKFTNASLLQTKCPFLAPDGGQKGRDLDLLPAYRILVTVYFAGYVEEGTCYILSVDSSRFTATVSVSLSVEFAFGDVSSRWCCSVSIIGDLRNTVAGVVQDLLLGGRTYKHTWLSM